MNEFQNGHKPDFVALRIALYYLFFGAMWILFSDKAADYLVGTNPQSTFFLNLQTIKGWLYVTVTAILLYVLISRHLAAIRRSQKTLEIQEGRYRSLIENSPVAICNLDLSQLKEVANSFAEKPSEDLVEHWSHRPAELRKLFQRARVHHSNRAMLTLFEASEYGQVQNLVRSVLYRESCAVIARIVSDLLHGTRQQIWEMPLRSLTGRELTVLISVSFTPEFEQSWSEVHIMMLDVTEQKYITSELTRSRRQLMEAQRVGQTGSWEWDINSGKVTWTEQMYTIYGLVQGSVEITANTYMQCVHPDDLKDVANRHQNIITKMVGCTTNFRIIRPDGAIRHILSACEMLPDENGYPSYVIGFVQDVTERIRDEEERKQLESQLRHAQKLESLGALAGGIAHDFNNILTPLYGYTELVMNELHPKSRPYEDLTHVMRAATRGKELVQQILAFSSQIEHERKPVLVHHIVNEAIKLLRATVPPTIQIKKKYEIDVDSVIGDPVQIHQVVMNLCVNACHAMRGTEGTLTLLIDAAEIGASRPAEMAELSAGTYVRLRVIDTGAGMDEAIRSRVFEPFFTTKPAGEGTGLGLSVSRQIVASHRGTITVDSSPGHGATFTVYLPLSHISTSATEANFMKPTRGRGKILFVDDETEIVDLARKMLCRLGYEVETAPDYDQALARISKSKDLDVIITDQMLASKSGIELALELRSTGNRTPIILLTGEGIGFSDEMIARSGIDAFQSKPFSAFDLSQTILRVIKQPSSQLLTGKA